MTSTEYKYVGKGRKLVEGFEKVTGAARYAADVVLPGMLYGRPILSPYAHAKIVSVDKSAAEGMPGVVAVLTADELPTKDKVITSRNSAILAKEKVLFVGQPVVVVVAESEMAAADAAEAVEIEYEPLPAAIDLLDAIKPDAPAVWPNGLPTGEDMSNLHAQTEASDEKDEETLNNVHDETHHERGDVKAGFAAADLIVERTYRTNFIHQSYMEPHACVAEPDLQGRSITIYTSTQGHFAVRGEVSKLLSMPSSRVKVVPMTFGGGFGAKYGIIDPLTSSVAMALKRPVRIVLSRSEDFLSTMPAPAMVIELKTGAKKDGTLTAIQASVFTDNGAFPFKHGGIIAMLLGGYYKCDNFKIDCYEVHTNKAPIGAYRAPGSPQATFALDCNMDDMARELGLDPLEFRLQNAAQEGDPMGDGRPWPAIGIKKCIKRMQAHPAWQNRHKNPNEGIGIAVGGWPTFMTPAEAICRVDTDGAVALQVGSVDISGVNSSFVLVAAEILGVNPDQVMLVPNDTSGPFAPNSGGSQVTYSVAGAVRMAAQNAKNKLLEVAAKKFEADTQDIEIVEGLAQVKGVPSRTIPIGELAHLARYTPGGPGPIVGEGHAAMKDPAPCFVTHLIKVAIEPETGQIKPTQYVGVQDVGFAINPMMVEGQMHGGMAQGLGMALHEATIYDENGQLVTGSFMDYCLPRANHIPSIETIMLHNPSTNGPFGARGVGEPPIIAGAAALSNAIKDATGKRLTELPMNNQKLWQALQ
ncbi:MAG: xanthine dehydrogenase family protein molybdopterin-binding subunit [Ardenticatenaceae bacterium]